MFTFTQVKPPAKTANYFYCQLFSENTTAKPRRIGPCYDTGCQISTRSSSEIPCCMMVIYDPYNCWIPGFYSWCLMPWNVLVVIGLPNFQKSNLWILLDMLKQTFNIKWSSVSKTSPNTYNLIDLINWANYTE